MPFKMGRVFLAVFVFLGLASSAAQAQYQNDDEIRYQPIADNSRAATVSSATAIQGCNAGLITISGTYTCRSSALVSQGGTVPDPVYTSSHVLRAM